MNFLDSLRAKINAPPPALPDQSWQVPLVQEICAAMIRRAPNDWNSAYIMLTPHDEGLGTGVSHSAIQRTPSDGTLLSPNDYVMPDTDVMAATRRFALAWIDHDIAPFNHAVISATRPEGGKDWEIRSEYDYAPDASNGKR